MLKRIKRHAHSGLRLGWFGLVGAALLAAILLLAPAQFGVILHKIAIVAFGGFLGYWLDRHLFPYARPHEFSYASGDERIYIGAMIRRAIIVGATIVALSVAI